MLDPDTRYRFLIPCRASFCQVSTTVSGFNDMLWMP
jgi:hypothetical protein